MVMKDMYNSNINLNLYKIFLAVAKSKSLSEASSKMNIEKTSISKSIKQLEDALGAKLFYRENKGMQLTKKGQELYEYIDKGLSYFETGEKTVNEKDDLSSSKIILGSLSHLSSFYVMDCIKKIKKDYPKLKIELITGSTVNNLIDLLENHKIDFAIDSSLICSENKEIRVKELRTLDNILISKEYIEIKDIKQLENYEYILGAEYSNTTKKLINIFNDNNIKMKSLLNIDTTELRVNAVKHGLGISYVMNDIVKKEMENHELYEVKVPFELPKSKMHLIYLKGHLSKADSIFIKNYLK